MAEVAATMPVEVAQVAVGGRGRGRGKAKGKKGKAKGKFKKMKAAVDPNAEPKPKKEPKKNLRTEVEEEVGERNIEDVIKEARAKVEALQAAVAKAQEAEVAFETSILEGKTKVEQASANVDSSVHKETIALEKFKAAKQALIVAQKKVAEKKLSVGEEERALDVISSEGEKSKKEADLIQAKEDAQKAAEEAKKAYQEAQARAKQVQEEIKSKRNALALTDDPDAEAKNKAAAEKALAAAQATRDAKHLGAKAGKDLNSDIKQLEKMRAERDKERAKAFKEASGMGKTKRKADGAASPAKAAKIQDVD